MPTTILDWIELLGTASFAVSGAVAAMEKRLDPFGVIILAFVTAIGGGTVRDLLLGIGPVSWLSDVSSALIILVSALVAMLFVKKLERLAHLLTLFDALGLGLFTLIGIEKGLEAGLKPGFCIALGTITGCFGGVIRDVLLNKVPLVFRREIYASASIAGGLCFFALRSQINSTLLLTICIALTVAIRLLALRFKWKLPIWYAQQP
jgi:uncharacterized membrane protein YeiH